MLSGESIYDGKPTGLTREGERRLRVRLMETPTLEQLAHETGLSSQAISMQTIDENEEAESNPIHFNIRQDQIVPILQALMKKYTIIDMGVEEQSLEAVIQRLYTEGEIAGAKQGATL